MKSVIAFFYILHGQLVSYTVSDYEALRQEESVPAWMTCEMLIQDKNFLADVRNDLEPGEEMRAECYLTNDLMHLGSAQGIVRIGR